jgi:ribosomal biogenesis protein LAS1
VLVRRWKSVMKVRMREKDVGEENDTGREVRRLKSDLEGKDGQEVVEALCKVGGLVPVARK